MNKRMKFNRPFYVQFYYIPKTYMAKAWGEGPHYAPFDTTEQAAEHVVTLKEINEGYVHKIRILSKYQVNKEDAP